MLKKKTASVSYHFVQKGVSADEWRTTYIHTDENPADILTRNLPYGENRYRKVSLYFYLTFIYPKDNEFGKTNRGVLHV